MATQAAETNDEGSGTRRIVGAVLQGSHTYVAGEEDALAGLLPAADIARLVEKGVLAGDWSTPTVERINGQPDVRGDDGLIHGDEISGDGSGEALPPVGDEPPVEGVSSVPPPEKIVPPAPQQPQVTKKAATKAPKKKSTPKRGS